MISDRRCSEDGIIDIMVQATKGHEKNELAHFCMRLDRPQTRGSSHFALFILDFANLSVQNKRIPSGCRLLHASGMRLATTEPGGETREQLRCEAIRRIRLLSMQSSYIFFRKGDST